MSTALPPRPSLEWLKKHAKDRLRDLRAHDPAAKLADAQLALARECGFPSWRKLKSHVEGVEAAYAAIAGAPTSSTPVPADDPDLAKVLAAAADGDFQSVLSLVSRNRALAIARGPEGDTPLHAGVPSDEPRVAIVLLSLGADPAATFGHSAHTPLSWAITYGSMNYASALVRMGHTPDLFCAAGLGLADAVRAFFDPSGALRADASRTGSSRFGPDGIRLTCPPAGAREQISDALYIACRNAKPEVVRILLDHDPDLSFKAFLGGTPLHWAYFGGSKETIEMLVRAGANGTVRDDVLGCTPRAFGICVLANWGLVDAVRRRLTSDPSQASPIDGTSALHAAVSGHQTEIVRILLSSGADPDAPDASGRTPRQIATDTGHHDIEALFP